MKNGTHIVIPKEYSKNMKKVMEICQNADLIIEVCDARLPMSGTNLLDYSDEKLQDKERLIVFSHASQADEKRTQEWVEYFSKQLIPCEIMQEEILSADKTNLFCSHWISEYIKRFENKTVAVIGLPHSGKTIFIEAITNPPLEDSEDKTVVFDKFNKNVKFIDTNPILGYRFVEPKVYWKVQMIVPIDDSANLEILAFNAFKLLIRKYKAKLETKYNLRNLNKSMHVEEIITQFVKILNNAGLITDEAPDLTLACEIFINDLRKNKIPNITLEWVEDIEVNPSV